MEDIEELKRKKEYLELKKEVAALEKSARINKAFNILSYKITIPLLFIGLLFIIVGATNGEVGAVIFGVILIIPFALKFFSRKG